MVVEHPNGENPLEKYTTNLNIKAQQGKIHLIIGRDYEVMRATQILSADAGTNSLFVGEVGVGKTAIAEWFGRHLILYKGARPKALEDATIYNIDLGAGVPCRH